MTERDNPTEAGTEQWEYTFCITGAISADWSRWFDGMTVRPGPDDTTIIAGHVVDQAALHRVIRKIRDLGVSLVSIERRKL